MGGRSGLRLDGDKNIIERYEMIVDAAKIQVLNLRVFVMFSKEFRIMPEVLCGDTVIAPWYSRELEMVS